MTQLRAFTVHLVPEISSKDGCGAERHRTTMEAMRSSTTVPIRSQPARALPAIAGDTGGRPGLMEAQRPSGGMSHE